MRAIATFGVVIHHFSTQYFSSGGSDSNWFYYIFNQIGPVGVDCFFAVSGYIMWITTNKQDNNTKATKVSIFVYKRITRIYFGYWPYFLLAILIISIYPNLISNQTNLWGSFFLTEPSTSKLLIQVAWTLQYELYFYGMFALLLLFPKSYAVKTIYSLITIILIYHLYIYTNIEDPIKLQHLQQNFFLSPLCLEFFGGCLLGHYFQTRRIKRLLPIIPIVLALFIFAIYYQEKVISTLLIDNTYILMRVMIFGTIAILSLGALIELELRSRVVLKRFSILYGGASYSIYLSHTLAIALVYALGWQGWMQQNSQFPGLWIFVVMLFTLAYSIIHYIWVEKPLMSMAKYFQKQLFRNSV